jgi:hypothetical protein
MENLIPPSELVQQWEEDWHHSKVKHIEFEPYIAAQAAAWGADMELEACCDWLEDVDCDDPQETANCLRAARRPKPPSLKELALEALDQADKGLNKSEWQQCSDTIRRALEQLDD